VDWLSNVTDEDVVFEHVKAVIAEVAKDSDTFFPLRADKEVTVTLEVAEVA
tara:strand:- start:806 stop:958 length:153 start_codon:yes stop_codon:yes gene_type:complete